MTLSSLRWPALLALAFLLLTTRSLHLTHVPDASWAALFLAGFYLSGMWPFGLLLTEAVLIDYVATQHNGLSSHCLTVAYVMIIPAYALLYAAGRLARHWARAMTWRDAAMVAFCLLAGVSLCFAVTDGAFYWWGGRYPSPDLAGWAAHFVKWYAHFLVTPVLYCASVFALHALWLRYRPAQSTAAVSHH